MWVAVGQGGHTIGYSYDGDTWVSVAISPISAIGWGVGWGNNRWVAVGQGTNTIAYSDGVDGSGNMIWVGSSNSIFTIGFGIAWNGNLWVAVGSPSTDPQANTIAYSYDGITWNHTTNGNAIITTAGRGVAWNGSLWVAVGQGTNTIAYSNGVDGSGNMIWYGVVPTIFSIGGYGVAWNGSLWVAVGNGTNSIATSTDGITWTGRGNTIMTEGGPISWYGTSVAWNGSLWIAVGDSFGPSLIITSKDGIHWFGRTYTQASYGIAFNSRRPYTLTIPTTQTSTIIGTVPNVSLPIVVPASSQLDIVSDSYYNSGYTNFSAAFQTHAS